MSLPRQILPGTTYLVTRRVAQRQFLLTPSALINCVVAYCLHRSAKLHGIELHAVQVLSNHLHIVLTDVRGELPRFMAWVDREIAKALNKHYGRAEAFWSSDHYSAVALCDVESVIAKLVYVFTNVVKANLVRTFREWPGIRSTPQQWLEGSLSVPRPTIHFDQRDKTWAEVEASFTVPPQLRDRDIQLVVQDMEALVASEEHRIGELSARDMHSFRGAKRCREQDPFDAPLTPRAQNALNPTFAAATAEGQKRARAMLSHFRSAYREALAAFRRGLTCVFPAGTYWLPRIAAVCCASLETARPISDAA